MADDAEHPADPVDAGPLPPPGPVPLPADLLMAAAEPAQGATDLPGNEPEVPIARARRWRDPLRWVLALAAIGIAGALLAVLVALALAATMPEYGFRPNTDSRAWALHPLALAPPTVCVRCHASQVALVDANAHATASCQGCHGAGTEHAKAQHPTAVDMAIPTSAICVRCHTSSVGRPVTVPQITVSRHYTEACLDCHNPHTATATRPPVVSHPLERLPACIVCHGPEGFQARNQRHPVEPTDDADCLRCHAVGRGRIDVPVGPR